MIALGAACAVGAAVLPLGPRAPLFSLLTAADVHRLTLANLIMATCYYALAEGVEVPLSQAREVVVSLIESMGDPEQERARAMLTASAWRPARQLRRGARCTARPRARA